MKREEAVEEFIKKWNMSIIEKPPHSISIGNSIWIYQNSKVKADLDGDILTSDHFLINSSTASSLFIFHSYPSY